ncbi:MAG: hypothetical protein H6739_14905 [Alphaproteobacteria bacterium]|nr:hypothetical protein [Alphaproteobacteria bacterium]
MEVTRRVVPGELLYFLADREGLGVDPGQELRLEFVFEEGVHECPDISLSEYAPHTTLILRGEGRAVLDLCGLRVSARDIALENLTIDHFVDTQSLAADRSITLRDVSFMGRRGDKHGFPIAIHLKCPFKQPQPCTVTADGLALVSNGSGAGKGTLLELDNVSEATFSRLLWVDNSFANGLLGHRLKRLTIRDSLILESGLFLRANEAERIEVERSTLQPLVVKNNSAEPPKVTLRDATVLLPPETALPEGLITERVETRVMPPDLTLAREDLKPLREGTRPDIPQLAQRVRDRDSLPPPKPLCIPPPPSKNPAFQAQLYAWLEAGGEASGLPKPRLSFECPEEP